MVSWHFRIPSQGSSLVVQWLGLHTSIARDTGSIPGQGTKIPQATWQKKKKKKSQAGQPTTWPPVCCSVQDIMSAPHVMSPFSRLWIQVIAWAHEYCLVIYFRAFTFKALSVAYILFHFTLTLTAAPTKKKKKKIEVIPKILGSSRCQKQYWHPRSLRKIYPQH